MTNLVSQNYNLQQQIPLNMGQIPVTPYSHNAQTLNPAMQGLDYDTLRLQAKDSAVGQATRHYSSETPEATLATMLKSFGYSLLMSIGFTSATNWLMSSKNIAEGATNAQNFTQTRLYKAGQYLDDKIGNTKFVQGTTKAINGAKGFFSKITPNVLKEAFAKMKMGSIAVWDKQGMYSLGKGAEALNDFVDATTKVPTEKLKTLFTQNGISASQADEVIDIINKVKKGSIRGPEAFKKIFPVFEKMPAQELAKLNAQGFFGKLLGVRTNLNIGADKARFFNGALNKAQGPIAKLFQKLSALVGEASGNGILGGKFALILGSLGLMQGFTAAANAEKGDKLKAFMEDYIGFTLGSYLMSFVVGTWFNKFLGVTELGMDVKSPEFQSICKRLGLDPNTKRVQEAVIAFNKEFKDIRKAKSILEQLEKGKLTQDKAFEAIKKLADDKNLRIDDIKDYNFVRKVGERIKEFDTNGSLRTDIKSAMKSKLTVKNAGLGKYIVQKPLELMGKLFSVGRYNMMDGSKFSFKSIRKAASRWGGGIGRMVLVGFVLVEPFRKGFVKLSHAIFGKPKNSALDEGKEKTPDNSQLEQLQQQLAQQQSQSQVQPQAQPQTAQPAQIQAQPLAAAPVEPTTPTTTQNNALAATELKRNYVPSAQPSQFALQKDPRELEVEKAIAKAEGAELAAQNFLSNGF